MEHARPLKLLPTLLCVLSLLARTITGICIFVDCKPGLYLTYFVLVLFYRYKCLITQCLRMNTNACCKFESVEFLEKKSARTLNESVN